MANEFPTVRLKYAADSNMGQSPDSEDVKPLTDGLAFVQGNAEFGPLNPVPNKQCDVAQKCAKPGDVLVSVRAPVGAVNIANQHLGIGRGLCALTPNGFDPKFLYFSILASSDALASGSKGSTFDAITAEELANVRISAPSLADQQQIVDFLDRETAKIDALIAEKERLLKLLDERRQALITEAVTRGLDPTVPRRDSGHAWLGLVPEHWLVERSRWLFKERDERSDDGSEELLTVSHLTGVTPRSEKDVNMFFAESNEGYKICRVNDLVVNTMWAWMGAMGVSWGHGICSPSYNVYEPDLARIDPEFLDYLSRMPTFIQEVTRHSKGVWSSRLRLYPDGFFQVWFALPPLEEQRSIVERIRQTLVDMQGVVAQTTESIRILRSLRQSTIESAVTGGLP